MKKLCAFMVVFAALLVTGCPERPAAPPPVEEEPAPPVEERAEERPIEDDTGI